MHEFILGFFKFLRSFLHFMKIVFIFCILMLLCYWIQNLTKADWAWLGFITPFLDSLLDISNSIYSVSFDFFGAVFELKYLSALMILALLAISMNLLTLLANILEGVYRSTHFICKKTEEAVMNKQLKEDITKEEKKITSYMLTIHTKIKAKYSHAELNVNIDEQNKLMLEFLKQKLDCEPADFEGGYLYQFTNFGKIDNVLDVLFKLLHSKAPLEYSICIQAGDNLTQLKKIASLKYFGKICMAADTSYRYKFNNSHRYATSQVGIFQNGNNTLELHEFKEIL